MGNKPWQGGSRRRLDPVNSNDDQVYYRKFIERASITCWRMEPKQTEICGALHEIDRGNP
jgi:hypothetical protein